MIGFRGAARYYSPRYREGLVLECSARSAGVKIGLSGRGPSDLPEFAEFLVDRGIDSMLVTPDSFIKVMKKVAEAAALRGEKADGRIGQTVLSHSRHGQSEKRTVAGYKLLQPLLASYRSSTSLRRQSSVPAVMTAAAPAARPKRNASSML
jgi:Phosphoenolpyruvate synthase/pyruvate phosphate dikinase